MSRAKWYARAIPLVCPLVFFSGCLEFESIEQPSSIVAGETFTVLVEAATAGGAMQPYFGICLPQGWAVADDKVACTGAYSAEILYDPNLALEQEALSPAREGYYWWVGDGNDVATEPGSVVGQVHILTDRQTGRFSLDYMLGISPYYTPNSFGEPSGGLNLERSDNHLIELVDEHSPRELRATAAENAVSLSWLAPFTGEGLLGYDIYRNGGVINADLVEDNAYVDESPAPGLVCYTISAVYAVDRVSFVPYEIKVLIFSGGTGSPDHPYEIATVEQLASIAMVDAPVLNDKCFVLVNDIDLDPGLPGGRVFDRAVLAPDVSLENGFQGAAFAGVLDGNGFSISNLTVDGHDHLGLIGLIEDGKALNLSILDAKVTGTGSDIGILAGRNDGYVTDCSCTGIVAGSSRVGGLVGTNDGNVTTSNSDSSLVAREAVGGVAGTNYGHVTASCSTNAVEGDLRVGGFVGENGGSIATSYSAGAVTGGDHVGGLVGENLRDGYVVSSYSTSSVQGDSHVGGLVGANKGRTHSSFWDVEAAGSVSSEGGTGRTTAEMQNINTFLNAGWDFVDETLNGTCDYWETAPGDYPRLRYHVGDSPVMPEGLGAAEQPYLIRSPRDLGTVWFQPSAHYRLDASVDLSGITWSTAVIPWFDGTFDGNGHIISNLHIQGDSRLGLFGELSWEAVVSNLGLTAVEIEGTGGDVGGLVGQHRGSITHSYSMGTVNGGSSWDGGVGGLVGSSYGGDIATSYSTVDVTGKHSVGGLAGVNTGRIATSFSTGAVSGTGHYIGGLVGYNWQGDITASYSTGAVAGDSHVGGLVGDDSGSIAKSYSTGAVTGDLYVGGLVGLGSATVCFWDIETSKRKTSDGGIGKNTFAMQTASTFLEAGWDLMGETDNGTEDVWYIVEGVDYPRLVWELYGGPFPCTASAPHPQNGTVDLIPPPILSWKPGGPALLHDVYFADSLEAVAQATVETIEVYRGRFAAELSAYDPGELEWGKAYYWRVDEIDEADPGASCPGVVWSFALSDCIVNPDPPDGVVKYARSRTFLRWECRGIGMQYDIYFGEDQDLVANAAVGDPEVYYGRLSSDVTTYNAGALPDGKTYYWRIDAVDEADPENPWKGRVWSFFTTDLHAIAVVTVDDFESYTNNMEAGEAVFQTWIDGCDNGTGSIVGHDIGPYRTTFMETEIVHGGRQSTPLYYDNSASPFYSEIQRTWETPQDWTVGDADALTLYFCGDADNDPEYLYVGIEDSAGRVVVVVHAGPAMVRTTEWQEWRIAFADLGGAGVDLTSVSRLFIGVGNRNNSQPGGKGRIYIDDISLTRRAF